MNLNTGRRIYCKTWTPRSLPDEVIKIVEQLGKNDNQPKLLMNTDKKGDVLIGDGQEDIEDDLSYDK